MDWNSSKQVKKMVMLFDLDYFLTVILSNQQFSEKIWLLLTVEERTMPFEFVIDFYSKNETDFGLFFVYRKGSDMYAKQDVNHISISPCVETVRPAVLFAECIAILVFISVALYEHLVLRPMLLGQAHFSYKTLLLA